MGVHIGFLHTATVHVDTFARLLTEADRGASAHHVVDASLLEDARAGGIDDALRARIAHRLRDAGQGSDAVLCTCSTIGAAAEDLGSALDVPVLRVDRPMAALAVATGRRIGIVAAVASTLAPTRSLLAQEAAAQQLDVELLDMPCLDAWEHFESGDHDGYVTAVTAHVDAMASTVDVIVLAQASMAAVADRCRTTTRVLTSPAVGVQAVLAAARRG